MKEWGRRAVAVCLGVAAALLVAEGVLRLVPGHVPIAFDLFGRDDRGNLRLRPGERRQHASPEWNVRVETNDIGFRDIGGPPRPGQPVILGIGDSLTFGWGVEYEEAYLTRLETALGGPQRVRVVKAGIPGTGPTDQLALLREILPVTKPQLVILGFSVVNDFDDVAEGGADQFDVVDGLLVRRRDVGARRGFEGPRSWLKRHSYLAQFAARQLWLYERRRNETLAVERRPHFGLAQRDYWLRRFIQAHLREPFPPDLRRGVDGTLAALSAMKTLAGQHGARFLLVVIPRSIQLYEADRRRYQEAFGLADDDWDLDRPQRLLHEWAERAGAQILDLLPALRRAAPLTTQRLYFFPDSHLSAAGHAAVARELLRYVERYQLPGVPGAGHRQAGLGVGARSTAPTRPPPCEGVGTPGGRSAGARPAGAAKAWPRSRARAGTTWSRNGQGSQKSA